MHAQPLPENMEHTVLHGMINGREKTHISEEHIPDGHASEFIFFSPMRDI